MLILLEKQSFWLANGTFKITSRMFYQLYTFDRRVSGMAPNCIWACLPNKTDKTYDSFLQVLIDLAQNCWPQKKLDWMLTKLFFSPPKQIPGAYLSGWFFHLSQSFIKKINELGLKVNFDTNNDSALTIKMLPFLAFERIGEFYDIIFQKI